MSIPDHFKKFLFCTLVILYLFLFSSYPVSAVTPTPTAKPTPTPTAKPTPTPTSKPKPTPTKSPTSVPTSAPIVIPSVSPPPQQVIIQKVITIVKQTITRIQTLFKKPQVRRRKKQKKPVLTLTKSKKLLQALPTPKKPNKPRVLNAQ